jgi:hypothetical protein
MLMSWSILELSLGAGIIAIGSFLLVYIKKAKKKLKKFVLRGNNE